PEVDEDHALAEVVREAHRLPLGRFEGEVRRAAAALLSGGWRGGRACGLRGGLGAAAGTDDGREREAGRAEHGRLVALHAATLLYRAAAARLVEERLVLRPELADGARLRGAVRGAVARRAVAAVRGRVALHQLRAALAVGVGVARLHVVAGEGERFAGQHVDDLHRRGVDDEVLRVRVRRPE